MSTQFFSSTKRTDEFRTLSSQFIGQCDQTVKPRSPQKEIPRETANSSSIHF
ncbi:hypothetical protein ACG2F4_12705 [Halalkalibaculum sp. DA3122]|uniref:hypothetical protein n=1 Tax=Halalkalibaculum sp. DA384 TaxID=3373606 RepID=UPI003754227A